MYAIIKTGGKQYQVQEGDVIDVELLKDLQEGQAVEFKEVLFLHKDKTHQVGTPLVSNCVVKGEWLCESTGPKVMAFKYKRRKDYRKKHGHRQKYSRVKITEIST